MLAIISTYGELSKFGPPNVVSNGTNVQPAIEQPTELRSGKGGWARQLPNQSPELTICPDMTTHHSGRSVQAP